MDHLPSPQWPYQVYGVLYTISQSGVWSTPIYRTLPGNNEFHRVSLLSHTPRYHIVNQTRPQQALTNAYLTPQKYDFIRKNKKAQPDERSYNGSDPVE